MKYKKILTVVFSAFMFMSTMFFSAFAGGKYAKIIFLSGDGTGKSSVMHVLVNGTCSPKFVDHSTQLDVKERFYELDENEIHYSVDTKLWDTSGEYAHKALIKEFCENATVAIIILDLEQLWSRPYDVSAVREMTWNWLDELDKVNQNCKLIIVGTKKDLVEGIAFDQAKENVQRIANYESVRRRVGDRIMYVSAQKDNPQELRNNLNHLISDAIKDYGLANLPDRPTKMSARIVEEIPKKVVTKKGTKTVDVIVPTFKSQFFKTGWFGDGETAQVKDGTTIQTETVEYEYTVREDDPANATYKIEYYGEF